MKTPLLDNAYTPHQWELLEHFSYDGLEDKPLGPLSNRVRHTATDLNIFTADSPKAYAVEKALTDGKPLSEKVFIYDVEVLNTGGDHAVDSGVAVDFLEEDYKGYTAGSILFTVFGYMSMTYYIAKA